MTLHSSRLDQAPNQRRYFFLFLAASLLWSGRLEAGSATWGLDPRSGDWNDLQNWMPATVPNGPAEAATFAASAVTGLAISANTELDGIVFTATASAYTITASPALTLTLSGAGITNNSAVTQTFVAEVNGAGDFGTIAFRNSASAGSATMFTARGSLVNATTSIYPPGGVISFHDNSSAGAGMFRIEGGGRDAAFGGVLAFYNNSSAGNGVFTANGSGVLDANGSVMEFYDTATADHAIFVNNGGSQDTFGAGGDGIPVVHLSVGAEIIFHDSSTAADAMITNNGGTANGAGGSRTRFLDNSAASNAFFTNNGGAANGASGGSTIFYDSSTANNVTVINNGGAIGGAYGGGTAFLFNSSADNATLIANRGADGADGGEISFYDDSTGGTARVEVFGNGRLDIHNHNGPGVTVGSLQGTGQVFLGANNLIVGSNNLSTDFFGVMHDGNPFNPEPAGGRLTKIGNGTLLLAGVNNYSGPTTVNAGKLIVNGTIDSGVTVNGGALGGSGTVGAVTVNSSGTLSPGDSAGILNVAGNLTLTLGATYLVDLNGTAVGQQYDQTIVTGAVSLGNATLSLNLGFTPGAIDSFTIINNDGPDAVSGTFNGLAEGAMFTADGQAFAISYQGGDGDDVVLTAVIPEPATWALLSAGTVLLCRVLRWPRGNFQAWFRLSQSLFIWRVAFRLNLSTPSSMEQ